MPLAPSELEAGKTRPARELDRPKSCFPLADLLHARESDAGADAWRSRPSGAGRYNTSEIVLVRDLAVAASTNKKVVIRRFDRESLAGYVNPQTYLARGGIELLSLTGKFVLVPLEEVKSVDFVRDFESADEPEQAFFRTRPKSVGLWVRLHFRDGEQMEGLLPNDLLLCEPEGFTVVPPNPTSRRQRVFVPRSALTRVQVLGVIGSPRREERKAPARRAEQMPLFE